VSYRQIFPAIRRKNLTEGLEVIGRYNPPES
jgi:hypothetical protein